MQYPLALLPLLAVISAAPAPAPVPIDPGLYPVVTVQPFLGPLCQLTNVALGLVCKFSKISLEVEDVCTNVESNCAVHYPTSFKAQMRSDPNRGTTCRVSVYAKKNCRGDKAQQSLPLTGDPSICLNSLFPTKVVESGSVSQPLDGPLLPFGFESLKLECE